MPAYESNKQSHQLDTETALASGDLILFGDVSDSNRLKTITRDNLRTTLNIPTGDTSTNTAVSVVGQVPVFADTSGKLLKIATGTGLLKLIDGGSYVLIANPAGDIVGTTDFQTLTNKTINGASNDITVSESHIVLTDITANNASTTKHGFLKKLPNTGDTFLDGQGNFSALPTGVDSVPNTSGTFTSYFTTIIPAPNANAGWTMPGSGVTIGGNATEVLVATTASVETSLYGLSTATTPLSFASALDMTFKFWITPFATGIGSTPLGAGDRATWVGLTRTAPSASNHGDITNVSERIGFIFYAETLYAATADGTAITVTSLGAYATVAKVALSFTVDYGNNVKFYKNGTLGATHTTNIPSGGATTIRFGASGYDGSGGTAGFTLSSITISEKLA